MATVRRLGAALMVASLAIASLAGVVLANGIGDLYAATPGGVLETFVDGQSIINTVQVAPAPTDLSFSNDGRSLYTVSGGRHIAHIDIETISLVGERDVPADAAAIAMPQGSLVVVAYPSTKTLGIWNPAGDGLTESATLPGAANLLAADRRDPRVVVAESGKSWVASFDPASGKLISTTVSGKIAAIAVDRSGGAALVATRSPNRLYRLTLPALAADWTANLPAAPDGLASTSFGAIVGGATALWQVGSGGAKAWATAVKPLHELRASDEGTVVYAAEAAAVEAFTRDGALARTIPLTGKHAPTAIAPVPHPASIANSGSGNGSASNSTSSSGKGQRAPSTNTILDSVSAVAGGPVVPALVLGLVLMALTYVVARWYIRNQHDS